MAKYFFKKLVDGCAKLNNKKTQKNAKLKFETFYLYFFRFLHELFKLHVLLPIFLHILVHIARYIWRHILFCVFLHMKYIFACLVLGVISSKLSLSQTATWIAVENCSNNSFVTEEGRYVRWSFVSDVQSSSQKCINPRFKLFLSILYIIVL